MGTILQEVGHDAVIVAFINKFLIKQFEAEFYLVTPAVGPKRDVYLRRGSTYSSVWSMSKQNYMPEHYYRFSVTAEDLSKLSKDSKYRDQGWYKNLSIKFAEDFNQFLIRKCNYIENSLSSDMPDILAFNEFGRIIVMAEIKFEGFSKGAVNGVKKEAGLAKIMGVPYYLIVPKKPVYGREQSDEWYKENLIDGIKLIKFKVDAKSVIPKQTEIEFLEILK